MKFDLLALKEAQDVTVNDVQTDLLVAKANLAEIVHREIVHRAKAKGVLLAVGSRTVVVNLDAAKDLLADRTADRWDHRIQNVLWKMRCVLMPTRTASSAKTN